jgi:hypothetical protein
MHTVSGYSTHRSEPNAPYLDLTGTLSHICVRREVQAKMDSSDGLVDGIVYRAHEIIAYRFSGRKRAGE